MGVGVEGRIHRRRKGDRRGEMKRWGA